MFPGGCFFIAVAAELDARPGPVRDHLRAVFNVLLEGLTGVIREAQALGEIAPDEDLAQLTYEIDAFLIGANFAYLFFEDRAALDRGATRHRRSRLARAAGPARATGGASEAAVAGATSAQATKTARHVARLTPACPPRPMPPTLPDCTYPVRRSSLPDASPALCPAKKYVPTVDGGRAAGVVLPRKGALSLTPGPRHGVNVGHNPWLPRRGPGRRRRRGGHTAAGVVMACPGASSAPRCGPVGSSDSLRWS